MSSGAEAAVRFERVVAVYGERLMAYLLRRVASQDAPDVAADVLVTAWRRVRVLPLDDEEAFWWLLAIARRSTANHRRGLVRRSALADRLRSLPMSATTSPADTEAHLVLRQALGRLAEDDQELVRLVYWDDLTIDAAAAVLGIGGAAARKRLQRARDRLRAMLGTELNEASRRP